jgi:bacterioferritin
MADVETKNYFLRDVKTLRAQAQKSLEDGALTAGYKNVDKSIELLQSALATEIVCVLRYTMNSMIAARIDQLGGDPNFNPEGLASRSATEYGHAETLVEMVEGNLVAERIAIEHYRDLIGYFRENDPSTRAMMEKILADEEDHASDMHDLLVAHQGTPPLPS